MLLALRAPPCARRPLAPPPLARAPLARAPLAGAAGLPWRSFGAAPQMELSTPADATIAVPSIGTCRQLGVSGREEGGWDGCLAGQGLGFVIRHRHFGLVHAATLPPAQPRRRALTWCPPRSCADSIATLLARTRPSGACCFGCAHVRDGVSRALPADGFVRTHSTHSTHTYVPTHTHTTYIHTYIHTHPTTHIHNHVLARALCSR